MSVEYQWHDHPLQLRSVTSGAGGRCFVCTEPVTGHNYGCPDCNFFLHVSCLFFPLESLHPLHPHQPLSLHITNPPNEAPLCNYCKLPCSDFTYQCSACPFSLHLRCASQPRAFDLEIHRHPLSSFASPPNGSSSFLCYVCGELGYGFSLGCLDCNFVIHVECASFPVTVTSERHEDPFSLTSVSSVDNETGEFYCNIVCEDPVNPKGCVYYCADCNFMAHLGCLSSAPKPHIKLCYRSNDFPSPETSAKAKPQRPLIESASSSEPISLLIEEEEEEEEEEEDYGDDKKLIEMRRRLARLQIVKKTGSIQEGDQPETQPGKGEVKIEHLSHQQHPLILTDKNHKHRARCFGCLDLIPGQTYICSDSQCNFWGLHKWCGELPQQIRHPLHPEHTLSLLPREPDRRHPCIACHDRLFSFCFVYNCKSCYVNIHAMCASIPSLLRSEIHDHPLLLRPRSSTYPMWCKACGFEPDGAHFECNSCDFGVDFSCALLPRKVRNLCHVDSLTLTNVPAAEDETEFLCNACEGQRYALAWVYYCADCEYVAHADCALYEVPGTKCQPLDYNRHEHLLSLITRSSSSSSSR